MPKIKRFLDEMDKKNLLDKKEVLTKYRTAERAYFSQEFELLREIGRHYERIGVLVKLGYLNLSAIFENSATSGKAGGLFMNRPRRFNSYLNNLS
jgi:hypothetical protein